MRQTNTPSTITTKVSEIFTSIEGEGILFGTKTMFVRLAGCPFMCHWCDTPYALPMDSGIEYSIEEVKESILKNLQPNTYKVNFTGGEPLVQHEAVIELAKFVRQKGLRVYLESSCYDARRFAKVLPYIDICKVEIKLRDSKIVNEKQYSNLLKNEQECLRQAINNSKTTFIKVVVTNSSNLEEFKDIVTEVFKIAKPSELAGFIIQPSYKVDEPTLDVLFGFYDTVYPMYDQVRVVPQLHKVIGAR
ncbi:MAG: 7-carboxy-7-deazaguanine synthase QueE [Thermoproteota archaeon]|nr:7-carboxy-7-deazaguanine synthase QueE [Thermoproteota archaeon]